jgi:hypothetical protein
VRRAAVLIGVDKTGGLPQLNDAARGARRMEAWALDQGLERDDVLVFTDEAGPLEVKRIKRAIAELVDKAVYEQLFVYFAGHGVNLRRGEYWLLSEAPGDAQESVNVEGSAALARRAGIPHVVFVSDACRTAAQGIQMQGITGSDIFPNDADSDLEQAVDIFFACTLGKPSFEIPDPDAAAAGFRAVYTDTLLDGLRGAFAETVEHGSVDGESARVVRPRPLKKRLQAEMTRRIAAANLQVRVNQVPDARITSDDDAWLARLPVVAAPGPDQPPPQVPLAATTLQSISQEMVGAVLREEQPTGPGAPTSPGPVATDALEVDALVRGLTRDRSVPVRTAFETRCGFRLEGARVIEAFSGTGHAEVADGGGRYVRFAPEAPATSVLLVLDDGSSVLVPAVAEFIGALRFEEGEFTDLAYEPSEYTWRWDMYLERREVLRGLRDVISAAADLGVFRLEGEDAFALAARMQYAKSVDPSLALYAAYAYHDLGRTNLIHMMNGYLGSDLNFTFFDIALLGRRLDGRRVAEAPEVVPAVPLLAQGWALLQAFRVTLHEEIADLHRHVSPSLWTQFTPPGTDVLRPLVHSGRFR